MKDQVLKLSVKLQVLLDENAQDLIEYALVVALIGFAATAGMSALAQGINNAFTTIGQKLTKPQLYDSILHPSAEILMGYENWIVRTKSGDVLSGRKTEDTDDHVTVLDAEGKYHDVKTADVDRKVKLAVSIMPEGLTQAITQDELVDLVEFLASKK